MADCEATPGLSFDLLYTNSMCMCVSVYALCVCTCVCVHVFVCMYVTILCKNISIISFSSSLQNKKMACVYNMIVCVHVYVCVTAWQMVAHICLIALAAKGLIAYQALSTLLLELKK